MQGICHFKEQQVSVACTHPSSIIICELAAYWAQKLFLLLNNSLNVLY